MIELVEPAGFATRPLGVIPLSDGTQLRKGTNGRWPLDAKYTYLLQNFLNQGFRVYEEPKAAPAYRDALHRETIEQPMPLGEILTLCHAQGVELRVSQGQLWLRTPCGISARLERHLRHQKMEIRSELERRAGCGWEEA